MYITKSPHIPVAATFEDMVLISISSVKWEKCCFNI